MDGDLTDATCEAAAICDAFTVASANQPAAQQTQACLANCQLYLNPAGAKLCTRTFASYHPNQRDVPARAGLTKVARASCVP